MVPVGSGPPVDGLGSVEFGVVGLGHRRRGGQIVKVAQRLGRGSDVLRAPLGHIVEPQDLPLHPGLDAERPADGVVSLGLHG